MISSGFPHASRLGVGWTILAVPSVPLNSVGHLAVVSFINAHIVSASQGENYIAIGCNNGIYVSKRGANCESTKSYLSWYQSPTQLPAAYRKVLDSSEPISMVAIQDFDTFLVHCESTLYSYPLHMVVRTVQGELTLASLINSEEKLGQDRGKILFFKTGRLANRTLSE